jgi:hypothetical protein
MVSVQELQSRSIEIIIDLRERHYPSFEIVVQILLDKYGFQHWSQFEVGSFENVHVLQYLFQFNQKVTQRIVFLIGFYVFSGGKLYRKFPCNEANRHRCRPLQRVD